MMSRLLLGLLVFNCLFINAQGPPPCGLTPEYVCDFDQDGVVEVDLNLLFPFSFCPAPTSWEEFYHPITYYLSEEDAEAGTNAIVNPQSFLTNTPVQVIWRRADPIDANQYTTLIAYDILWIVAPLNINEPTPLIACDLNENGFAEFDLSIKTNEILASQYGYSVNFYETNEDAINDVNRILSPYLNTIAFTQTVYVRVSTLTQVEAYSCFFITELDLIIEEYCEDVEILLVNTSTSPRPGFDFSHQLIFRNTGLVNVTSGTITYTNDQDVILNSAVQLGGADNITTVSDGVSVDFFNLQPQETRIINLSLSCPSSVSLGEIITSSALYSTNLEDVNPNNDNSILSEMVVGSYDPNNKMESHGQSILIDDFDDEDFLYYTIRFQNLGTAEAINIRIEDELDSMLDESTFQQIRSSHASSTNRNGTSLSWTFNAINLPAEQNDPEGSKGYVYFKIKPKQGYLVGDIIPNTAAIYFDFNAPVITNRFETEFVDETLSISEYDIDNFELFPNPVQDILNVKLNTITNANLSIYDIQGKLVIERSISNEQNLELNVSNLQSGLYFVKLNTSTKEMVKKLIIN